MAFKPVDSQVDFVAFENELLDHWYKDKIVGKYLHRNDKSEQRFSFLDGPITANNPMGVHHAWGRTYKDVFQRYYNMKGYKQRFQNGFDEQGLWVEVNVEKELGLKNKKDILNLVPGDEYASLEKFVNLCKERVQKYSAVQTEQSKRLGYFMDWDNSYHTSSEQNNYAIWNFLKVVNEKGWLYKGHDSVPWCPRCGTAISQHEILTEDYAELEHESVYVKLPILGRKNEYLVVWTTTPWTVPANVAVAVDPEKNYLKIKTDNGFIYLLEAAAKRMGYVDGEKIKGKELVGLEYEAPYDHLERIKKALANYTHRVVESDLLILPISEEEGTGLVHIATGAGTEDFQLGKKLGLPVIELIDEEANYLDGMGELSNENAKWKPELILEFLKEKGEGRFLLKTEVIKHRYPRCWRCRTELVWRVVDEWYIAMDKQSNSNVKSQNSKGETYREQMVEVAKKINWMPKWALGRELDWLKNMHDWLISKKRFWGLSLPIWECTKCGYFEVIGSKEELKEKAVAGWDKFEGNSPHRPWVDQVKVKCSECGETSSRIPDVGNPWLDAGIVPFSTLPEGWFPADFVTEGFPGQFKNWFYSLIAMSTALKRTNPFKNLLGFANLVDEKGHPMHKSAGNSIEFNEAADKVGVDPMRWLYLTQNPEVDLRFGYNVIDEIKRRFYLIFWNSYKFFIDKAVAFNWSCDLDVGELRILDKWVLARLTEVVLKVNASMEKYDTATASRAIEDFIINDLSTWYIRRIRDRVGSDSDPKDRNKVLSVLYGNLVALTRLTAPFMPFITEQMYLNLETGDESVHLTNYPKGDKSLLDDKLVADMKIVRQVVEMGHAKRKESEIKLRQPLAKITYSIAGQLSPELEEIMAEELNVKKVEFIQATKLDVELDIKITPELKEEGEARDLIRQIQQLRKEKGLTLKDKIELEMPYWPKGFESMILTGTAATKITKGVTLRINKTT